MSWWPCGTELTQVPKGQDRRCCLVLLSPSSLPPLNSQEECSVTPASSHCISTSQFPVTQSRMPRLATPKNFPGAPATHPQTKSWDHSSFPRCPSPRHGWFWPSRRKSQSKAPGIHLGTGAGGPGVPNGEDPCALLSQLQPAGAGEHCSETAFDLIYAN